MNWLLKLSCFAFTLIFALQSPAQSGGGVTVGGGGSGFEVGGRVFLADLYLARVHLNPYFGNEHSVVTATELYGSPKLASIDTKVLGYVAIKLHEVDSVDPIFAKALFDGLLTLSWAKVDDVLLKTEDMTAIPIKKPVLPLAVRQGQTVYIHEGHWLKMDLQNRAALIIHEVAAALAPVDLPAEVTRRMVAALFTPRFYVDWSTTDREALLAHWPSFKSVQANLPEPFEMTRFVSKHWFPTFVPSGVPFEPQKLLVYEGPEVIVSPFIESSWTRKPSFKQKLAGISPEPITKVSAVLAGRAELEICQLKSNGVDQAYQLAVKYPKVVLFPQPIKEGMVHPSLGWRVEIATLFFNGFIRKKSAQRAQCSEDDLAAMKLLGKWAETLRPF